MSERFEFFLEAQVRGHHRGGNEGKFVVGEDLVFDVVRPYFLQWIAGNILKKIFVPFQLPGE